MSASDMGVVAAALAQHVCDLSVDDATCCLAPCDIEEAHLEGAREDEAGD